MNWKIKAKIQNVVAFFPASTSYWIYYLIQRSFGRLRKFDVLPIIKGGINTFQVIKKLGYQPVDKVFFEVGTGRVPIVPLVYWLMGAKKTITVDLNPYIKEALVQEALQYIFNNEKEIKILFGDLLDKQRFKKLLEFNDKELFKLDAFLALCSIEPIAPGDASNTELKEKSIDFHTSFTVYEHIPSEVISLILQEGNRLIKDGGLFVNVIDYFDHFMHFDNAISSINFLQYSDMEWDKYAGNKYMYMNRLRHDDFIELFHEVAHEVIFEEREIDHDAIKLLESGGLKLDSRFEKKSNEVNCIQSSWVVSRYTEKND